MFGSRRRRERPSVRTAEGYERWDQRLIPEGDPATDTQGQFGDAYLEVARRRCAQEHSAAIRTDVRAASGESGQSLVEFSLVLMPLFFILLGIIQFGFIFNTYVTMTNAARDAARLGTVYVYDRTLTKAQNDLARNESIKTAVLNSMNMLAKTSPHFSTSGTWSQSGQTFTNGDLVITYRPARGRDVERPANRPGAHGQGRLPPGPRDPAHLDIPAAGRGRSVAPDRRSHDGPQLMRARTRRSGAGRAVASAARCS